MSSPALAFQRIGAESSRAKQPGGKYRFFSLIEPAFFSKYDEDSLDDSTNAL